MAGTVAEYSIVVVAPTQVVDDSYLASMKASIVGSSPSSYSNLELLDKDSGYSYTYAKRCYFPGASGSADCP